MNQVIADILSRLDAPGWVVCVAPPSVGSIESAAAELASLTIAAVDIKRVAGTWDRGPIQALIVDRAEIGDDPTDALYFSLHVPTMGVLVLLGWKAGEPTAPPVGAYKREDGRLWCRWCVKATSCRGSAWG